LYVTGIGRRRTLQVRIRWSSMTTGFEESSRSTCNFCATGNPLTPRPGPDLPKPSACTNGTNIALNTVRRVSDMAGIPRGPERSREEKTFSPTEEP